jgi:hypothetical protein
MAVWQAGARVMWKIAEGREFSLVKSCKCMKKKADGF